MSKEIDNMSKEIDNMSKEIDKKQCKIRFYSSCNGFHTSKDGVKTPFDISKTGMTWPNFKEAINDWGLYWKYEFKDDSIIIYSPRGKHGELRKEE